jgi:hypothetical protein
MWKCNRGHRFDSLPFFLLLYVLQCNRVSKNSDELKLAADPNEKCSGPKYEKLVTYSYISLAVYGVGIPLLFSVILFRHRWVVEMCFPLPVYHRLLCSFPPPPPRTMSRLVSCVSPVICGLACLLQVHDHCRPTPARGEHERHFEHQSVLLPSEAFQAVVL